MLFRRGWAFTLKLNCFFVFLNSGLNKLYWLYFLLKTLNNALIKNKFCKTYILNLTWLFWLSILLILSLLLSLLQASKMLENWFDLCSDPNCVYRRLIQAFIDFNQSVLNEISVFKSFVVFGKWFLLIGYLFFCFNLSFNSISFSFVIFCLKKLFILGFPLIFIYPFESTWRLSVRSCRLNSFNLFIGSGRLHLCQVKVFLINALDPSLKFFDSSVIWLTWILTRASCLVIMPLL